MVINISRLFDMIVFMTYQEEKEELEILALFIRLLDESETSEMFSINCVAAGHQILASKKFFDENLFMFLYGSNIARKKRLKLKIELLKRIEKLNRFYKDFVLD